MTRPPIEVRDAAGVLVAKITRTIHEPAKAPKTTARRVAEIIVFLIAWKLVAWLLLLSVATR